VTKIKGESERVIGIEEKPKTKNQKSAVPPSLEFIFTTRTGFRRFAAQSRRPRRIEITDRQQLF